jgi:copper transport protein
MLLSVSAMTVLTPRPASAHALLVSSSPQPGAVVTLPVGAVRLSFTEPLDADLSRFAVATGAGRSQVSGHVVVSGRTAYVPVSLHPGPVVVTWIAVGGDAHPVRGQYVFTAAAVGHTLRAAPADFSEGNAGSSASGWVIKGGRFTEVTLLYLVLGTLAVRVLVLRGPSGGDRLLLGCGVGSVVLVPALFAAYSDRLHRATGRGTPLLSGLELTWLVKLALWVGFCLLVVLFTRREPRRRHDLVLLGTAAALALAFVANTHAAGRSPVWAGVMWLHVLVTAVWAGGLAVLLLVVLPAAGTDRGQLVLERFSRLMVFVVLGIVLTGAALLGTLSGSWQRAWCTGFGITAGFKLSVVALALSLGLVSNRIVAFTSRRLQTHTVAIIHRVMAAEVVTLLVVLALSAQLGETALPPAIKGALLPGDAQTSVTAGFVSSGCR